MRDLVLTDAHRVAMWQRLSRAADGGITHVHHWGLMDGLPVGSPPPAHQHAMPTLVLPLSGVVRVVGKTALDLHPGELLIIEPGCWHDHVPHKPGSTSFGLGFLAGQTDVLFFDESQVLWGAVPQAPYQSLMSALIEATAIGERLELADRILQQVVSDRIHYVDWIEPGVLAMAAHLWNHLHQRIDANTIVTHAGLSRTQAYQLFKAFFHRSPKQELLAQRLDLARWLLHRGLSVTETALRCGFHDRADLTRAWRRAYGAPPSTVD